MFPNFKVNTALGLFVRFVSGVGFIVIRDQTDRTLRYPGEMKQWAISSEPGTILTTSVHCKPKGREAQLPKGVSKSIFPNGGISPKSSAQYNLLNLADVCNWPITVPRHFTPL